MKSAEEWIAMFCAQYGVMGDAYQTVLQKLIRDGVEALGNKGYHYAFPALVTDEWLAGRHLPKNYRARCQSILEDVGNLKTTDITPGTLA